MKILLFAIILFFLCATPAHAQVVISEVYPAPTSDENEWIELYNPSETTVDISNWKLFEHFSSKNELTTFVDTVIEPKSFFVFNLSSNKLNNSEEKVSLENELNEEISYLHYTSSEAQKSISYLFIDESNIGTTQKITQPTKEEINQLEELPTPTPSPTAQTATTIQANENQPESTIAPTASPTTEPQVNEDTPTPTQAPVNYKLLQHQKINSQLKLPNIEKKEKPGLIKRLPQFSYIVQKKVSQIGVIDAIIGGTLIVFAGLLF